MTGFMTSNGYELSISSVFGGLVMCHFGRARRERGHFRILNHQFVQPLWNYFDNPQTAVIQEQVSRFDPNDVRDGTGLRIWSTDSSGKVRLADLSDDEIAALRELYQHLDGQLPAKAV